MTAKQPDWEAIERAYRAGSLSIRTIAERNNISDTAIRSKARKNGWTRDLSDQVRQAAKAKLVRTEVRTEGSHCEPRTDDEIVEEAATEAASVVLAHRTGLANWRAIADKLSVALAEIDVNEDNLGDFSRALNAGVDAQLKVIKGERQAYGLDSEEGNKTVDELAAMMDELVKES